MTSTWPARPWRCCTRPVTPPERCASTLPTSGRVFTGDTLFQGGPGATGRSFSDSDLIVESIRARLLTLPDDTVVHTGHGADTTIGAEKALMLGDRRTTIQASDRRLPTEHRRPDDSGVVSTRVSTSVAALSPLRASRLRRVSGTTSTPRVLIVSLPDASFAQGGAQRLLAERHLLEHLVALRERRVERRVRGHPGDVLVDEPAVDTGGQRGDQPGPDHRTVGFVEEATELANRTFPALPRVVVVGERRQATGADDRCPASRSRRAGPTRALPP